jgi:hypothetical protein
VKRFLDEVFSSQPNLMETAVPNADLEFFTDGSRSPQKENRPIKQGLKKTQKVGLSSWKEGS